MRYCFSTQNGVGDDMINFSERKEQNDRLEEGFLLLKTEYHKQEMSKEQVEKLRAKIEEAKVEKKREQRKAQIIKYTAAAAVFLAVFIVLPNTSAAAAKAMERIPVIGQLVEAVTFRDYEYQTERNMADIKVPKIKLEGQSSDKKTQEKLEHTAKEINAEIQKITDELIEEFESNLEYDWGYQDVVVESEVLTATEDYFTLKLNCYQGAGSGYQWNYYYTIDLNTGERLKLRDIFQKGADYITLISANIKEQMKAQMEEDENVVYWLDNEIEEWNFKEITEDVSFYLNEKGNVVIGFNEGDVAPMYMGAVEFEIPSEVLRSIRN